MYEVISKLVKTDVTCIKCYERFIFAGIGGDLFLFKQNGKLLHIYNMFTSQRIYGIVPNNTNKIVVYGGYKLKIIEYNFVTYKFSNSVYSKECGDWILDIKWIDNDKSIVIMFANHLISYWRTRSFDIQTVACEQKCLLYSSLIVNDTWDDLFVFSGTIFRDVLLWKPSDGQVVSPVICKLKGHDGVIFSINYNKKLNLVITTSDDRTVRFWDAKNIFSGLIKEFTPIKTIYGHHARVFKSLVIKDKIISAGEDSNILVWNLDGKLVRKYESHQNGCVWALDKTENGQLVSGGGDSGISIYPFDVDFKMDELETAYYEAPKILKILNNENVILMDKHGYLKLYEERKWVLIEILEELKSYVVMELSKCRNYLALGGFDGLILIYKIKEGYPIKLIGTYSKNFSRIYSIHWLSSDILLTSESDGYLQLWKMPTEEQRFTSTLEFSLPPSKERWVTAAVLFKKNCIAVGDRKGNIHLYKFGNVDAVQTIKKAHNHLGITGLYFINNQLISLGRNGILKKYSYEEGQLVQISNDKLPFSWLTQIIFHKTSQLLLGFSGSNFIIWDHQNRRILHEINCGGGHRSWDFHIDNNSNLNFTFIKDKSLHQFSCQLSDMLTLNIIEGYHTKEINALTMLQINKEEILLISGGEDTTLRLSVINLRFESDFNTLDVFKSHLSSIRCIKTFQIDQNCYLVVSAGGRAQIILWKLKIKHGVSCYETDSYYKNLKEHESEIRVMDITMISTEHNRILVSACSDGSLRCYIVNKLFKLKYIYLFSYALKCIIKVDSLKICGRNVIVSMATDGMLVFWDFTDFSLNLSKQDFQPFFSISMHQSGINSFSYRPLTKNLFLFVSGGDDNALNLNILQFSYVDKFAVCLLAKYSNSQFHGAQITGVYIKDEMLITTSIDQNVNILEYCYEENVLCCKLIKQYSSVVADIQGMSCLDILNKFYVCVHGKGIELIEIGDS